jgi:hypothetical protein
MVTLATLALALADCLEVLDRDPAELEVCIAKYPGHQETLDTLLRLAAALKREPAEAVPRDGFLDGLKSRLMSEFPVNNTRGGEAE